MGRVITAKNPSATSSSPGTSVGEKGRTTEPTGKPQGAIGAAVPSQANSPYDPQRIEVDPGYVPGYVPKPTAPSTAQNSPAALGTKQVVKTDRLPGIVLQHMSDGTIESTVVPIEPKSKAVPDGGPAGYRVITGVDQPQGVRPLLNQEFVAIEGGYGPFNGSVSFDSDGDKFAGLGAGKSHAKANLSLMSGTVLTGADSSFFLRGVSWSNSVTINHITVGTVQTPDGEFAIQAGFSAARFDASIGPSYAWKWGENPLNPLREALGLPGICKPEADL